MTDTSTLSKKWKSPEWKARKKEIHNENVKLRAELQSKKSNEGDPGKRAEIQSRIDAISKKGNKK